MVRLIAPELDPNSNKIHREHRYFIGFLKELHMNQGHDEKDLIDVCEKPWKWQSEFNVFLNRFGITDVPLQCHVYECHDEPNGVDGKCAEHSEEDLQAIDEFAKSQYLDTAIKSYLDIVENQKLGEKENA